MKLFFRLIWLVLSQRWRTRCSIMGPVDTTLRVYPNDLDVFTHVNNGVYLTYADLGRTDLLLRSDAFGKIRKKGWYPVIAGATVEFRKSLKLAQRFTICTRVLGWDDKAVYMEQIFTHGESTVARAMIDARFISLRGDRVKNDELFSLLGVDQPSPELPNALKQWIQARKDANVNTH